ncbi:MAG: hypothetical protein ABEJ35_01640 [Halobacteriaceae archaeon]
MVTVATMQWVWRALLALAVGLVGLSGFVLVAVPGPTLLVWLGQGLAVLGAVAMLMVASLVVRHPRPTRQRLTTPAPAIAVLGGMTGFLIAVSSTGDVRGPLLAGVVLAGAAGLLGGVVLFGTLWPAS